LAVSFEPREQLRQDALDDHEFGLRAAEQERVDASHLLGLFTQLERVEHRIDRDLETLAHLSQGPQRGRELLVLEATYRVRRQSATHCQLLLGESPNLAQAFDVSSEPFVDDTDIACVIVGA
jgi:hypothetical protein